MEHSKSVIVKAVPWYVYERFGNSTATMAQVGVTTDTLRYTAVVWIIEGVRVHVTAIETASKLKHCSCFFHANLLAVYLHALHIAAAVVEVSTVLTTGNYAIVQFQTPSQQCQGISGYCTHS